MFRKNEAAGEEWSPENVQMCAERQREILEYAYQMLRPGGRLCYSTCTFAPAENEGSIGWLLKKHPDLYVLPVPMPEGFAPGHPEWADMEEAEEMEKTAGQTSGPEAGSASGPAPGLEHTMRLWPHRLREKDILWQCWKRRERPGRKNSRQNRRQRNFLQNGHAAGTGKKDWEKRIMRSFPHLHRRTCVCSFPESICALGSSSIWRRRKRPSFGA